jgi:type II secretory pathway pseudopilin PulG
MQGLSLVPRPRTGQCGFTLFESVLVIGMLAAASAALLSMQPRVFAAQTAMRDTYMGQELQQACAERILAVRRQSGLVAVTSALCNGMGGLSGFASNPTVALLDDTGATSCTATSVICTATIRVTKSSGPAAPLAAITLRMSQY